MPSPAQIRAARAMLNWSRDDLAAASGLSADSIFKIEKGHSRPQRSTDDMLIETFAAHGIMFTENEGVRKRNDLFRLIEGPAPYLELLEDVFLTLKGTQGEVLFFYIDNSKSPQAVIDTDLRMRNDGIRFRSLIDEEQPFCLYPLKEYRCIPHAYFYNNPIVVYADKVGAIVDTSPNQDLTQHACHLTRNESYANSMRRIFDALWHTHKMPTENLSKVTYD